MRLPRVRFTVRWMMIAVVSLAVLVVTADGLLGGRLHRALARSRARPVSSPPEREVPRWTKEMARKAKHYREMAAMQARLETSHREEERRWLSQGESESAQHEAEEAGRHARLRALFERLASHPEEVPPPGLPMTYPWDRERDRDVLEAVLTDLIDPKNPLNPIGEGRTGREVILDAKSSRWAIDAEDAELEVEDQKRGWTEDLWTDFRRRNDEGPFLLTSLRFRRTTVHLDDLDKRYDEAVDHEDPDYLAKVYPDACTDVRATLPGYSRDGKKAAVLVWRVPFLLGHAVTWTYLLAHTPGGWEVERRHVDVGE